MNFLSEKIYYTVWARVDAVAIARIGVDGSSVLFGLLATCRTKTDLLPDLEP
jgi:hypothetical protein